jgi:hypothetical protein
MKRNRIRIYKIESNHVPIYKIKSNRIPIYKIKNLIRSLDGAGRGVVLVEEAFDSIHPIPSEKKTTTRMRGNTMQINWHDLQPVLTLDFNPVSHRLPPTNASQGPDSFFDDMKMHRLSTTGCQRRGRRRGSTRRRGCDEGEEGEGML